MKQYKSRICDALLADILERKGAVLINGPKWCGKTTTAKQKAKSILYFDDPDTREQNILLAKTQVKSLLVGKYPRLIDEWQLAPQIWDAVRFDVDHSGELGRYILTGSAVPISSDATAHSGTGRFAWLTMRPMSLFESGESSGNVRLSDLFKDTAKLGGAGESGLDRIAFLACRGGWPLAIDMKPKAALGQAFDYVDAIVNSDISRVDRVLRDSQSTRRLLRSLARHQGAQASVGTICADLIANEASSLHENTIYSYIGALRKIFVVEDMPAWNPNLRSKAAIRTSETRYFVDPSIATASLGLGPSDLIADLKTFGLVFETLAVRDLRCYAEALDGNVYHFRDSNGLECDAVIHLRNGSYGLVEIKIGGEDLIEAGAATLLRVESEIDTQRMKAPAFKMVLTATGTIAYRRQDGVYVVPITALRN